VKSAPICDPELAEVVDFGDWSSRDATKVSFGFVGPFMTLEPVPVALQRSYSAGALTDSGKTTSRHPTGHPTAFGSNWISAT